MPRKPRSIAWSTLSKRFTQARVRAQIADLQALVAAHATSNEKSLSLVARNVQEAAKRGIGQTTPARTRAGMKAVGAERLVEIDGGLYRDTTMIGSGKPRPAGKPIRSWNRNRGSGSRKRFVYENIMYFWDDVRQTFVIGPYMAPELNQLHEFGGTTTQTLWVIGKGKARIAKERRDRTGKIPRDQFGEHIGVALWRSGNEKGFGDGANDGIIAWQNTKKTRTAQYPARPFVQGAAGVQKALEKANRWFRDTFYPRRAA